MLLAQDEAYACSSLDATSAPVPSPADSHLLKPGHAKEDWRRRRTHVAGPGTPWMAWMPQVHAWMAFFTLSKWKLCLVTAWAVRVCIALSAKLDNNPSCHRNSPSQLHCSSGHILSGQQQAPWQLCTQHWEDARCLKLKGLHDKTSLQRNEGFAPVWLHPLTWKSQRRARKVKYCIG